MKNIKSFLTIGLGTAIILGTVADSAEAGRGSGRRNSGSRSADISSIYEFDLFELDDFFNKRTPDANGTFIGAVENFSLSILDVDGNGDFLGINDDELDDLTLNFTPRFVTAGSTISLLNGTPVIAADPNLMDVNRNVNSDGTSTTENDRIEFTITGDGLNTLSINELTLFIDDVSSFASLTDFDTEAEFSNSINTNGLTDIIEQDLLSLVNGYRVTGLGIPVDEFGIPVDDSNPTVIFSEDFPVVDSQDISTVPESNNVIGLLGIGCLGISLLVKKKIRYI